MQLPLKIIYQDEHLIAIDKPSGLLVHRSNLDAQNTEFAVQRLRDQIQQEVYPCHRLDRPTSGALLFALNREALRETCKQFEAGTVQKTYHAIVRGWPDDNGRIDYPLRQEEPPHKLQDAITDYICLSRAELPIPSGRYTSTRVARLQLHPHSGRKHQLRRHLAHIRHPIMGDTRHGDGAQNRFLRAHANCNRLLLRATELHLYRTDGTELHISAGFEDEFETARKQLTL